MHGAVLYAPYDIRDVERPDPTIIEPTDAIIRLSATCVCGSDLWPYRGIEPISEPISEPTPMGHEYVGIVEEVGSGVTTIKPGQFVVGSFFASDNTCPICLAGYQSRCVHAELIGSIGTQAQFARIPLADGTLVATRDIPSDDLIPSLLAASDVLGTGWFAAVGLLAVLAAKQLGAERIIAMSRHEERQRLAVEFGAGQGADRRARRALGRRGRRHPGVDDASDPLYPARRLRRLRGRAARRGVAWRGTVLRRDSPARGPAPVRRFLPELIDLICTREIDPGKVFDLTLPLEQVAEGYRAMDERRAIKVLLCP